MMNGDTKINDLEGENEVELVMNLNVEGASLPPAPPDPRKDIPPSRSRFIFGIVSLLAMIGLVVVLSVMLGDSVSNPSNAEDSFGEELPWQEEENETPEAVPTTTTSPPTSNTPAPVPPPTTKVPMTVQSWLIDQGIVTQEALQSEDSYQKKAVAWLDEMMVDIPTTDYQMLEANDAYNLTQMHALACLYYATNTNNGNNWVNRLGFLSSTQVCEWQSRNFLGMPAGVICSNSGLVISLRLDFNGLRGAIIPEVGLLWSLEGMDLEQNQLTGTIPAALAGLPRLASLFLNHNHLTGPLPSGLGRNGRFRHLTLSNNENITGPLPASMIQSAGTMNILAVDNNQLIGDINFLNAMVNLTHALLEDNNFMGTLGSNFLAKSTKLRILDLSDNDLDPSPVPEHLFGLASLETLDLHGNHFQKLPDSFPANDKLKFVALHQNQLEGTISDSISNLESLSHLDLSQNKLTGPLPTSLPARLTYLFLAENNFVMGEIPQSYGSLSFLRELNLKNTNRTGIIPSFLATNLPRLVLLDLDDNQLSGAIPEFRGNQTENLYALLLNRNNLTGAIPSSLASLHKLSLFFVDRNSLTGSLSASLCRLPQFVNGAYELPVAADCEEVDCDCCTFCCTDNGSNSCHDNDLIASSDPNWERDYRRPNFEFGNGTFLWPAY